MKKNIALILCLVLSSQSIISAENLAKSLSQKIYLILGINPGAGIVDNVDVDVITGATKVGFRAGGRYEVSVAESRHNLETGLDITYQPQTISYNDDDSGYLGKRKMNLLMLRLPVSYNIHLFRDKKMSPLFVAKIGSYFTYIPIDLIEDNGNIPDYNLSRFSREISFSLTCFPFRSNWGINFEGTRGVEKLYQDNYHKFSDNKKGAYSGISWSLQYLFK